MRQNFKPWNHMKKLSLKLVYNFFGKVKVIIYQMNHSNLNLGALNFRAFYCDNNTLLIWRFFYLHETRGVVNLFYNFNETKNPPYFQSNKCTNKTPLDGAKNPCCQFYFSKITFKSSFDQIVEKKPFLNATLNKPLLMVH